MKRNAVWYEKRASKLDCIFSLLDFLLIAVAIAGVGGAVWQGISFLLRS